jgi:transcriptional regulator with XRE-family HTH domain
MDLYNNDEMSEIITRAMDAKGISIRGLAERIDIAYEASRRIVRGSPPSKPVLRLLCKELDLDFATMQEMSMKTQLRRKYGDVPLKLAGRNPELEPIEKAWAFLTADQKKDATAMIQAWANRAK